MARLPDLLQFAKKHNLKIASVAELIEYRKQHEDMVELGACSKLPINLVTLISLYSKMI